MTARCKVIPGQETVGLLTGLIGRLLAAREPDGSSLFDHATVVFGNRTRKVH